MLAAALLAGAARAFSEEMYRLVTIINADCPGGYGLILSHLECGASDSIALLVHVVCSLDSRGTVLSELLSPSRTRPQTGSATL